jgi:glycosyltransferase involved in cell wall biosynthesis
MTVTSEHHIASAPFRCVQLVPDTRDAGAENQARYLLEGLREREGIAPELAYFGVERAHQQFTELGVPMRHVPRHGRFRFDAYGRMRRLRRGYAGDPPEILHTWLLEGNVIGLAAARAWPETRVVITQAGSWNELDHPGLVRLERLLLSRADHAISNSQGGAEMLADLGMAPARISVIPNGIPESRVESHAERESLRAQLGWSDHEVVAWAGRMSDDKTAAQKDFGGLLAAARALRTRRPSVILAVIGATRDELSARGFELPEWAAALGWRTDPADLFRASDLVAISSRMEGSSNVAGEALLVGTPVVSTDCGDHCEVVRMTGGQVVRPGDPEALARGMDLALERQPNRNAIRRTAQEALSVSEMVERTQAVYEGLLGR